MVTEDKVRGLTTESGHSRKKREKKKIIISVTKEVEILQFEIFSFSRLLIS